MEYDVRDATGTFEVGGSYFLEGVREKGVRPNPRNPPGYGPVVVCFRENAPDAILAADGKRFFSAAWTMMKN